MINPIAPLARTMTMGHVARLCDKVGWDRAIKALEAIPAPYPNEAERAAQVNIRQPLPGDWVDHQGPPTSETFGPGKAGLTEPTDLPEDYTERLPKEPETDPGVIRPAHYSRYKIEPIYFIMENNLPFEVGNVVKYVLRYDAKDGLKDLRKARRYIDMLIGKLEGNANYAG